MNEALLIVDRGSMTISVSGELEAKKEQTLATSALICRVNDADSNAVGVLAQQSLYDMRKLVEKAEEEAKKPLNALRSNIIETCRIFLADIKDEEMRIAKLLGDFQALENAKRRAAEHAEAERLSQLERERQKALAEAKTHQELEKIQEAFHAKAQEALPVPVAAKATAQKVSEEWEIEIKDIWLLARAHPSCVKIEALKSEIKSLLNLGVDVKGVNAKKVTVSRISASRRQSIEV